MVMVTDFTLIIPTRNRQRYALRGMRFWSDFPVVVHVLDGSEQPIPDEDLSLVGRNVTYHHLPISITDRLQRGAELVETEFALLGTDDEFYVPSSLASCVQELRQHPDLISCIGRCLRFNVTPQGIEAWPVYTEMAGYAVTQSDAVQRMVFHMNPYRVSSLYSVMKSGPWKRVIGLLAARRFQDAATSELQFELATAYLGKSKVISELMWLRSTENAATWNSPREPRFDEWWPDVRQGNQRTALVELTAAHLATDGANSTRTLKDAVESAFDAYVQGASATKRNRSRTATARSLLRVASRLFPSSVKTQIKRSLRGTAIVDTGPAKKNLLEAAAELERSGVVVDYGQLKLIEQTILSSHGSDLRMPALSN